jgi:hypothetical protein
MLMREFSAIFQLFFAAALTATANIYLNTLFLSTYPSTWLPYLFTGQALLIVATSFLLIPLIATLNKSTLITLETILLLGLVSAFYVIKITNYWIPLIFCFYLLISSFVTNTIATTVVNALFHVGELKKIGYKLNIGITLGFVLAGLAIPFFILKFGLSSLLYGLIALLMISMAFLYFMDIPAGAPKSPAQAASPMNYPLCRKYILYLVFISLIGLFVDYVLKYTLAHRFGQVGVGEFMSTYIAAVNTLSLIATSLGTTYLVKRFGVLSLFKLPLLVCLCIMPVTLLFPNLWTIACLAGLYEAMNTAYIHVGNSLLTSVLPTQIRNKVRLQINGFLKPSVLIAGSGVLLGLAFFGNKQIFLIAVALFILSALFTIKKLKPTYEATLKEAIKLKRFETGLNTETDWLATEAIQAELLNTLREGNVEERRFALSLLFSYQLKKLPSEVIALLHSSETDIRLMVARLIKKCLAADAMPALLDCLSNERDPEVLAELVDALTTLNPKAGLTFARTHFNSEDPDLSGSALRILWAAGDDSEVSEAAHKLKTFISDPSSERRRIAAHLLQHVTVDNLETDIKKLLNDPATEVIIAAMYTVSQRRLIHLAPELINCLDKKELVHHAVKNLSNLGKEVEPFLLTTIKKSHASRKTALAIRALALVEDASVEVYFSEIIHLFYSNAIIFSVIVKELAYRARRQNLTMLLKQQLRTLLDKEAHLIRVLNYLEKEESHLELCRDELRSRRQLTMMRYLYTLAAYSKADTVLPTLAILSPVTDIKYSASEKANALELIDVSLRDRKLAAAVDEIFNEREKKFTLSQEERDNFLDPSLRELVSLTESDLQKPENLALFKLLQLRKTLLFSKLPSEVLHQVAEKMTLLTLGVGETLFKQGDVGSGLYIVVSGKIDLIKNNVKLPAAKPYQLLGELALIDKKPRAATAMAAVNSTLFFLEKSAFDELLEENPDLLRALAQVIMHYLRKPAAVVEGE